MNSILGFPDLVFSTYEEYHLHQIKPRNLQHLVQVFCIVMMCSAACFFGLILGELEEIYASANMKVTSMSIQIDSLDWFIHPRSTLA